MATAELLLVDDSKVMREMIAACLRPEQGLAFSHAGSGLEAIERLSLKKFDLVILDLNMPDIGGSEGVEVIRAPDRLRELPIPIGTTRGRDTPRSRGLAAGPAPADTKAPAPR